MAVFRAPTPIWINAGNLSHGAQLGPELTFLNPATRQTADGQTRCLALGIEIDSGYIVTNITNRTRNYLFSQPPLLNMLPPNAIVTFSLMEETRSGAAKSSADQADILAKKG